MSLMRTVTQPPPLRQSTLNLLRASRVPVDDTGGRWVHGFAFQPLPSVAPWTDDACLSRAYDIPSVGAPTGVTATIVSAVSGSLTSGVQRYVVTAVNVNGETVASQSASVTAVSNTNTVDVHWVGDSRATGHNVYGTRGPGSTYGLLASNVQGTVWTDTGAATATSAAPPTANSTGGPGSFANPAMVEYTPPIARVWDRCSVMSGPAHLYVDRVNAVMDATWITAMEYEFWTGSQAQRSGWPNPYLASSSATDVTPGAGAATLIRAIELLEEQIAGGGASGGTQGMIHMRPEALALLIPNLRREGGLLLTPNDTIIVPGNGYPNWGPQSTVNAPSIPAAGEVWMYATGLTDVRYDDVQLFPDANNLAEAEWKVQALSRNDNEIILRAERFFAAVWDGQLHAACRAKLDT